NPAPDREVTPASRTPARVVDAPRPDPESADRATARPVAADDPGPADPADAAAGAEGPDRAGNAGERIPRAEGGRQRGTDRGRGDAGARGQAAARVRGAARPARAAPVAAAAQPRFGLGLRRIRRGGQEAERAQQHGRQRPVTARAPAEPAAHA